MRYLLVSLFCLLLGVVAISGCSGGLSTVSGKVTYKDKPVTTGSVQFMGNDGNPAVADINSDGTYTLKIRPGDFRVAITSVDKAKEEERQKKMKEWRESAKGGTGPRTPPPIDRNAPSISLIPEKYNTFDNSTLTATVKSGTNKDVNFELKD